jgi:hypothetical protein
MLFPAARGDRPVLPLPRLVRQRHVSAGVPLDEFEHLFDTEWVARPMLNVEQPTDIPQRSIGRIPVVVRLVRRFLKTQRR